MLTYLPSSYLTKIFCISISISIFFFVKVTNLVIWDQINRTFLKIFYISFYIIVARDVSFGVRKQNYSILIFLKLVNIRLRVRFQKVAVFKRHLLVQ